MALSAPLPSASQKILGALEVVGEIFQEESIKICMKESAKGGLITGVSALVGGLLGGKTGLLAGTNFQLHNSNLSSESNLLI